MARRSQIYRARDALRKRTRAGLTAEELAEILGCHGATAGRHLRTLVGRGEATRERVMTGTRGQPAWRYLPV